MSTRPSFGKLIAIQRSGQRDQLVAQLLDDRPVVDVVGFATRRRVVDRHREHVGVPWLEPETAVQGKRYLAERVAVAVPLADQLYAYLEQLDAECVDRWARRAARPCTHKSQLFRQIAGCANDVCGLRQKLRQFADAVATSRAGHRPPTSGRAALHQRWDREPRSRRSWRQRSRS